MPPRPKTTEIKTASATGQTDGEPNMDMIDSQFHIGRGQISTTLAAMDALGLTAMLIDEYWSGTARDPGYALPNTAFRALQPTAELAAMLHPGRFAYLVRVDRNDPELPALIRITRDAPNARALRLTPRMWPAEAAAFAAGQYDSLFAMAADCGLPIFLYAPGLAEPIARYAQKFPALRIILDHCGLISNPVLKMLEPGAPQASLAAQRAAYEKILALAEHKNIALKWAHAPANFAPNPETLAKTLRQTLNHFGPERVMWASDLTANQTGETWADLLFAIRANPAFSTEEQKYLLGATARFWLNWPA